MTKVTLECRGSTRRLTCSGHATGSVQVCAAVTALAMALAGWTHNAQGVEVVKERLCTADVELEYIAGAENEAAFDLVTVGFLQLAAAYGEFISVEILEE